MAWYWWLLIGLAVGLILAYPLSIVFFVLFFRPRW